jgi:hypothetical protein
VLELAADGRVLVMTPTGSETGGCNSELSFQLQRFARSGTTWKAFDSSTGFRFPDNSVLSPDASLVRLVAHPPPTGRGGLFGPPTAIPSDLKGSRCWRRAPNSLPCSCSSKRSGRVEVTADYEINLVTLISTMAGQQELPNPRTFLYSDTHAEEFI